MPKVALPPGMTDEDYVLALLRATGVLCVYGSGFGTKPEDGFFRIVFLASPGGARRRSTTSSAQFTADFLARPTAHRHWPATADLARPTAPDAERQAADPLDHLDDRARRHPAVGGVPGPRRAAAPLHQRPARGRLQPDRPPDRAAAAAADRVAALSALAGDPHPLSRRSSARSASSWLLVIPPLVDQAQQLWSVKDEMFEKCSSS